MNVYVNAYTEKQKREQQASIYQAYLISRWVWQKKIDIKKILNTEKQEKAMTDEQMLERIKVLNAIFGGEVKVIGKE